MPTLRYGKRKPPKSRHARDVERSFSQVSERLAKRAKIKLSEAQFSNIMTRIKLGRTEIVERRPETSVHHVQLGKESKVSVFIVANNTTSMPITAYPATAYTQNTDGSWSKAPETRLSQRRRHTWASTPS
ncbi:MAG: hypothetical protein WAO98_07380 [Alphaproteobacteria bacterium]